MIPNGKGPFPGVVLVHGSGAHDRDETLGPNKPFRDLAEGLASCGVAVLRYEKRNHVHAQKIKIEKVHDSGRGRGRRGGRRRSCEKSARTMLDGFRIFVLGHSLVRDACAEDSRDGFEKLAGIILMAVPLDRSKTW